MGGQKSFQRRKEGFLWRQIKQKLYMENISISQKNLSNLIKIKIIRRNKLSKGLPKPKNNESSRVASWCLES